MPYPDNRPSYEEWYKTVPKDRNDTTNYNLRRAYELAPMEELERWRTATPKQLDDDGYHLMSVYFDPKTGVGEFMKSKNHPTIQGELDFYNGSSSESQEFRKRYALDTSGEYYRYVPREQKQQVNMSYNLFKKEPEKPLVKQPDLTVPNVYDPTKDVADNLAGKGAPSGDDKAAHYRAKSAAATPTVVNSLPVDPNSDSDGMDVVKTYFTSPEEEERKRRASVANQRIAAVGDALRHIGNIYYTTKGAPAQKFNNPVKEEEERYQKEKAIRDRNNQYYMTYKRAKEKQDALAAYNRERLAETARANKARQDENVRYHDLYLDYLGTRESNRQEEKAKDQKISQQNADIKEGRATRQNKLDDIRIANGGKLPKGSTNSSSSSSSDSKGGRGGSKKGAKEDKDAEYYRIKARDPKGVASVSSGYKGGNKGERAYIVDEYRKKYGGGAKQKAGNTKGSSKKSTGGKKSTGVTWK